MIQKNKLTNITGGLAALISLLVYIRSVSFEFVNYDDYHGITQNLAIRVMDWQFFREAFQSFYLGAWMPLTLLSFATDYYFWGLDPRGYHLTNILLHSANTFLVVLIADRVFQEMGIRERAEGFRYPAILLIAGLIWGVHPLRVESVAWVSERKDVLNGLFSLGSIYFYFRYVSAADSLKRRNGTLIAYILCITFFVLSLMAKPVGVVIPVMLLVVDWYPLKRLRKGNVGPVLIEKIPFLVLSAIVSICTILCASGGGVNLISYKVFPFFSRVELAGNALFEYCRMTIYPSEMVLLYLLPQTFPPDYLLKTIVVALFSCFVLFSWKKMPLLPATWALFILPLSPVLGFFQSSAEALAPHYTYLSSVAPSIVAAGIFNLIYQKYLPLSFPWVRFLVMGFIALSLSYYSVTSLRLISSWQNSETLWTRQISTYPIGRAYQMRGEYYMERGRYLEAAADFLNAINIAEGVRYPNVYNSYAMRGDALRRAGRYEDSVKEFSKAIRLNPQPNYYYHRGLSLRALGKNIEAADDFVVAGNNAEAVVWLGSR